MASPNKPEFDGPTLTITLASGITSIDTQADLYSQWKEWVTIGDNAKYPPAFRTIGGDPLTPGITAGAYFFIQNQYGWRIRPPEEDTTIFVEGNLAPEDSSKPIVIPTIGTFRVLIVGLQPITQNVEALLEGQQVAAYNGEISIDTVNGTPGTSYPIGTESVPVSNLVDAITLATTLGITSFIVRGDITLTQAFTAWEFHGKGSHESAIVRLNGQNVDGSRFENIEVVGAGIGEIDAVQCSLSGVSGVYGIFHDSGIDNSLTLDGSGRVVLHHCFSQIAGTAKPILDCSNAPVDVSIRGWTGGLDVINFGGSPDPTMTLDIHSGAPRLNASCTGGTIVVRGTGDFVDNSAGTTVIKDGFVDGKEMRLAKQLIANNVSVSLDDRTVTIYDDDGITTTAVYDISVDGRIRTRTA